MRFKRVTDVHAVRDAEKHLEHPEPDDKFSDGFISVRVVVLWMGLHLAEGRQLAHSVEAKDASRDDRGQVDATDHGRNDNSNDARSVTDYANYQDHVHYCHENESGSSEDEDCRPSVASFQAVLITVIFQFFIVLFHFGKICVLVSWCVIPCNIVVDNIIIKTASFVELIGLSGTDIFEVILNISDIVLPHEFKRDDHG